MTRNPFYVVLIVIANKKDAANKWLEQQGYGPNNLSRGIILKTDPDSAPAKAYACMLQCDVGMRTALHKKQQEVGEQEAKIFWSMDRKEARQKALDKIDEWGYKLKPKAIQVI